MQQADVQTSLHAALAAFRQGRNNDAFELYSGCWQQTEAPLELRIDAAIGLGRIATRGSEQLFDVAEAALSEAKELAREQGYKRKLSACLHLMALLQRRRGNLTAANELLDQSPVLTIGDRPSKEMAQHFHYRALLKNDVGEVVTAERMLYRAYQFYLETNYATGIAAVCDSLANTLLRNGKTDAALVFASRSLKIKREFSDRVGEAISWGSLGRIHLNRAEYDEARDCFEQDLRISIELDDRRGIGQMYNSLGEVALAQREYETAETNYRRSAAEYDGRDNLVHAQLGLAHTYLAAERLDEAAQAIAELEGFVPQDGALKGMQLLRHYLTGLQGALAWRRDGDVELGERLVREAVDELVRQNHAMDAVSYLYQLRDLYQRQGQMAQAIAATSEAVDILSKHGAERRVQEVEGWLRSTDQPQLMRLALQQHFPPFVAEQVSAGTLSLRSAERKHATILFSDVRGYTSLSEGLDPEGVVVLLNEWFAEVSEVIRRHGGFIDKFIGDAVMAVFGVGKPGARVSDEGDAVRAALDMSEALWAMNLRHEALGKKPLRIGIGVASGEVVVGFVGSHLRQSYTAIGDAVNIASRLEGETKNYPGAEIFISEDVERVQRGERIAETSFVGNLYLKGKDQCVSTYEVLGRRSSVAKANKNATAASDAESTPEI